MSVFADRTIRNRLVVCRHSRFVRVDNLMNKMVRVVWSNLDGTEAHVLGCEELAWAAACASLKEDDADEARYARSQMYTDEAEARR